MVAGVGWGIGDPEEKVSVPEPLHPVEAGEPDSKASDFAKALSANCSWNFVKLQRDSAWKADTCQAFAPPSIFERCLGLRSGMW